MFDKLILLLSTVLSVVGSALLRSRRSRLVSRARDFSELAAAIEEQSPEAAAEARELVGELVTRAVALEQAALGRRFEISGAFAWLLLVSPAAVGFYFAVSLGGSLALPLAIASGAWLVIWTAASWGEVWKVAEPQNGEAEPRLLPSGR